MTARLLALSATAAALAFTACAPRQVTPDLTLNADRHRPVVTQEIARLDLPPSSRLAPQDRAAIAAFLREYSAVGHGPLVVSAPSGEDPAHLAGDIRAIAESAGMVLPEIALAVSAPDPGSPYNITFLRYRAHAPECGQEWPSLAHGARDDAWPNFGCANAANLAAMIADPADLLGPAEMTPADAERRTTILRAWRAGTAGADSAGGAAAGDSASAAAGEGGSE
jgi:pilus assembly protein CpaD